MRRCSCNNENNNILGLTTVVPTNNGCMTCSRNESLLDTLSNYIGNRCTCEFSLSNDNELEERTGILENVGDDYIELRSLNTGRRTLCSTENLVFITVA